MTAEVIPLGMQLRRRREELGLSQAEAARELDVARTAYRLWEMQAARPAPDRWRVIAKWLGISTTALLLAGEMLDAQEARDAERTARDAGFTSESWDRQSSTSVGDFFSQERAMIAEQATAGRISSHQAANLRSVLGRLQDETAGDMHRWHPGQFVKRLPSTVFAPSLARAALLATAVGVPEQVFGDAELLTTELVTNSVKHAHSEWIELEVVLDAEVLRVSVRDQTLESIRPRTPTPDGGWGTALVAALATRWGVERETTTKSIWVEFDLTAA